jgi:hypothetical protein
MPFRLLEEICPKSRHGELSVNARKNVLTKRRSHRFSGAHRSWRSNLCHPGPRIPCICRVSGPVLHSWGSGEAGAVVPLLSPKSGCLRSRCISENVDIRSWLLCPFKLVRVWVEVGICAYHAVDTTNLFLMGARLNLRACGHYLATKKKEAYQSRHTCPFDRKHKKKSLRDSDPEDNTPKHRSGR